ncbi:hypothetical protein TWF718_010874 [Orbilia javanica]|uniref:Uncharacterized protein n=1 Tax=Orbilia javanica TaxID=47235 RepID=A0AAN8MV02_9PEZI
MSALNIKLLFTIIHILLLISSFPVSAARSPYKRQKPDEKALQPRTPQKPTPQNNTHKTQSKIPATPRKRSKPRLQNDQINPQIFPGPTKATLVDIILTGTPTRIHTWIAATEHSGVLTTYTVSTPSPKPTLVYNCNIVPALCNAAEKHLGAGVATTTLIYDRWKPERLYGGKVGGTRTDERRKYACGNGKKRLLPPGENRVSSLKCPAVDAVLGGKTQKAQPGVFTVQSKVYITTKVMGEVVTLTTFTPAVFPGNIILTTETVEIDEYGVYDATETVVNQLAVETEVGGERRRDRIPYKLSCEEFPPATSVQGGLGAETYCVQIRQPMGYATEQNWQGSAIAGLRNYAQKLIHGFDPQQRNNYTSTNTLFEYDFEMRYSNGRGAVWVEGGGEVEYCYGPWGPNPKNCREVHNQVTGLKEINTGTELHQEEEGGEEEEDEEGRIRSRLFGDIMFCSNSGLKNSPDSNLGTQSSGAGWDFGVLIGPESA